VIDLRPRTGRGVRVAVVDSGILGGHPHVGEVAPGIGVDVDGDVVRVNDDGEDVHGHGTACAGVIRWGAPHATLVPVRVLDRELGAPASGIRAALERLLDLDVQVVNLSLGIPDAEVARALHPAADALLAAGVTLFSAVRADGLPSWPSTHPGVIAVGADPTLEGWQYRRADDTAPVAFEACPYPRPIPGQHPKRNFAGTSFAAPRLAALAARALEADPTLDRDRLVDVLAAAAVDFDHTRRHRSSRPDRG